MIEKPTNSTPTTTTKSYKTDERPSRQRSGATESSLSDGRRRNRDEVVVPKLPTTLRTQFSSSTISSSKFNLGITASNRITINGQTYEKVIVLGKYIVIRVKSNYHKAIFLIR